jgi:hypothetical protein
VLPELSPEVWTAAGIIGAALLGGIVRKVWNPLRKFVATVDAIAGRPERYPGDEEAQPGLAERFDRIDKSIKGVNEKLTAMRSEVDAVKTHVQNLETECPS